MKSKLAFILLVAALGVFALYMLGNMDQETMTDTVQESEDLNNQANNLQEESTKLSDQFVNDSIYAWHDSLVDWIALKNPLDANKKKEEIIYNYDLSKPIEIDWNVLMDIEYRLRYFPEIEMEMYSPVFTKAVEALHEKTVIIKGYVIPFDLEDGITSLSLSLNPYASCFFCGNASPASVISLYPKKEGKSFKLDAYKKFKGTLYLNIDDPDEFYYILRNAEEI